MGLLATLAARGTWGPSYTLKDPALAELYGYGRRTLAGPVVSEITALTCTAFWDGVNQISNDVSKQPLNLHKRRPGDEPGSDVMRSSPTHRLMKFGPNPDTRPMVFRRTLTQHALVYGNGYAEIVRDTVGRPRELWVLHPTRVQPFYQRTDGRPGRAPLRYRIDGETILDAGDVLHIQGLSDDAVSGMSLVGIGREAIGLAMASSQFASAFFGNGTRFGGVLSSDQELDEDQRKEITAAVEALHAKSDKAFRLLVLGAGFSYQGTGSSPNDAQMKEIRDQQVAEVARLLNIPVSRLKLNTPGAVSYNSVEMQDLAYYKGPILDWSTVWEQELDAKLIPALERGIQFWKHNPNVFLRGDIKSRYEALGIARDKGIISANEWRELEDMNPQEGESGDLYLVQSAQVPAARLNDIVDAQVAPPPAPVLPAGDDDDDADEARAALAAAEAQVAAAAAEIETVRTDLAAAEAARADAEARIETQTAAATAEITTIRAQIATLETAKADDKEAATTEIASLRADLAHAEVTLAALEAAATEKDAELVSRRADVARLQTLETNLEAVRDFAQNRADALERALDAEQAKGTQQRTRMQVAITAYRDLVLDTMTRMVRLETDTARRKQKTPETLRAWLQTFPTLHRARVLDALTPIVRVHLALTGSEADAAAVADLVVRDHLAQLVAAVTPVIDGDRETFHAALETVLESWERSRPAAVADAVLREELNEVDADA